MRCTCGFDFVKAALASIRGRKKRKYESYAIIADEDYVRCVRLECKALAAPDKQSKLRYVARSATLVGTVKVCPKCSALLLIKPKTAELVRYTKTKE
ncbi:MAG: hypothetical protein HUU46_16055 [Candidatus Hydrogenedentes bacterium]|nr:hypothetical protein [Candidatus Hydrogenedentota bacterium]